jgi:hypothetical protein
LVYGLFKIFRPKCSEETTACGRVHYEDLHDMCFWVNCVKVMKSRRIKMGGECGIHKREQKSLHGFGYKS